MASKYDCLGIVAGTREQHNLFQTIIYSSHKPYLAGLSSPRDISPKQSKRLTMPCKSWVYPTEDHRIPIPMQLQCHQPKCKTPIAMLNAQTLYKNQSFSLLLSKPVFFPPGTTPHDKHKPENHLYNSSADSSLMSANSTLGLSPPPPTYCRLNSLSYGDGKIADGVDVVGR
jgi:hypothetical protein